MIETLKDTADIMLSDDYKERFRAEYHQLKIRYKKLCKFNKAYEDGELEFRPNCSLELLRRQERTMEDYLKILEMRAKIEKVIL